MRKTDAHIYSKDLCIFLADPALNCEVQCYDTNPLETFPTLTGHQPCRSSTATVTCLLTAIPQPGTTAEHVSVTRRLTLVTVCIVIAASLVGSPLLAGPLWLECAQFSPGFQSLSGPIDLHSLIRAPYLGDRLPQLFLSSPSGFSQCRPSHPLAPIGKSCMAALTSQSDLPIHSLDPQDMVLFTNMLVHPDTDSAQLLFHVSLGTIHPFSEADTVEYQTAVGYTAQHLSDIRLSQVGLSDHDSHLSSEHLVTMPGYTSALPSGLDSSLLSEFLDNNTVEHEHAFPPTGTVTLKPDSLGRIGSREGDLMDLCDGAYDLRQCIVQIEEKCETKLCTKCTNTCAGLWG